MTEYRKPNDVSSPKEHWNLIGVLRDGGSGEASYAVGTWDGEVRVACRWNGSADSPIGNPQSSGHSTWMILEPAANAVVIQALGLTDALLDLVAEQHENLNR